MYAIDFLKETSFADIEKILIDVFHYSSAHIDCFKKAYDEVCSMTVDEDSENVIVITNAISESNTFFVSRNEVMEAKEKGISTLCNREGNNVEYYACDLLEWDKLFAMDVCPKTVETLTTAQIATILLNEATWCGFSKSAVSNRIQEIYKELEETENSISEDGGVDANIFFEELKAELGFSIEERKESTEEKNERLKAIEKEHQITIEFLNSIV